MTSNTETSTSRLTLSEALSIARYHIMLVAMAGMVTFSFLLTNKYQWSLALVVAVDWFLINLMNRITDIAEDLKNGIPGTERVARQKTFLTWLSVFVMVSSFAVTIWIWPELTAYRVAVQLIGAGYNYNIVPTPRFMRAGLVVSGKTTNSALGLGRFKEMYFFKNFGSAMIFLLTCFCYPLVAANVPWSAAAVALVFFFIPFELTYEILYDLRDLEGDRAEGVPTYPVVHGERTAIRIIDGLLVSAMLALLIGIGTRALGSRQAPLLCGPIIQAVFYKSRIRRGLTSADCIGLTHLGSAQIVTFLICTYFWDRAGLPFNAYI